MKISSLDVVDNICKFANNGLTPSKSGIVLADSHEIAQVNRVTGSKTVKQPSLNKKNMVYKFRLKNRFLQKGRISKKRITVKRHGLLSEIPKDLYELIKKKAMKEHGLASEMPKDLYDPIPGKKSIASDTPNDLNESIPKKRNIMEGQGMHFASSGHFLAAVIFSELMTKSASSLNCLWFWLYIWLESDIPKELNEPISKKRKTERHEVPSEVPKDFSVFIPKKRRTVKGRGLSSKQPKDVYELCTGYPSEIPKDLYENAVKGLGLASDIPERMYMLVKKAVAIRKYLETNKGNRILKLRLMITEDSIEFESSYYKFIKLLPPDWKYDPTIVRTLKV